MLYVVYTYRMLLFKFYWCTSDIAAVASAIISERSSHANIHRIQHTPISYTSHAYTRIAHV